MLAAVAAVLAAVVALDEAAALAGRAWVLARFSHQATAPQAAAISSAAASTLATPHCWRARANGHAAPPGEKITIWHDDTPILVVNLDGEYYAVEDKCSHEDFELSYARAGRR